MRPYVVILLLSCCLSSCQKDEIPWIDFFWESGEMGSKNYEKAAMFINYNLNGSKSQFSSQFDTGSFSFFDESLTLALATFEPSIAQQLLEDKASYAKRNGEVITKKLKAVTLNFGNIDVLQKDVFLNPSQSKRLTQKAFENNYNTPFGTIGSQFCKNKIIMIDYPNTRLARLDSIPASYSIESKIKFQTNDQNWVLLPLKIAEKSYYVVFDTGSSIFPLLTRNRDFWEQNGNVNAQSDTLQVRSFGKVYETYEADFINIATQGISLHDKKIYLSTRPSKREFFNDVEIIGLTGNALFLDKVIAIDYINREFNILKK